MAAPTIRAIGAVNSGTTGPVTYALPAHQPYDILYLLVETNSITGLVVPTGWSHVVNSPRVGGSGVTATSISLMWMRALSSAETDPVIAGLTDHQVGFAVSISGALSSGTAPPVAVSSLASGTAVTVTPTASTVADSLILLAFASAADTLVNQYSGLTNANLTGLAINAQGATDAGNGGALMLGTGVKAAVGTIGATNATLAIAAAQGNIAVTIAPGTPGGLGSATGAYDNTGSSLGYSAAIKQGAPPPQAYDFSGIAQGKRIPTGVVSPQVADWSAETITGVSGIPAMAFGSASGVVDFSNGGAIGSYRATGAYDFTGSPIGTSPLVSAVAVRDVGAGAGYTAAGTYVLPVHQANDILLLGIESGGPAGVAAPAGWADIPGSPTTINGGANGGITTLNVFWRRATSSFETNPTVAAGVDHHLGLAISVSGIRPGGNPFRDIPRVESGTANLASASMYNTASDSLTVVAIGDGLDLSSGMFPTGIASSAVGDGTMIHFEVDKYTSVVANGGEVIFATGLMPAPGYTGGVTGNKSLGGYPHNSFSFVLVGATSPSSGNSDGAGFDFTGAATGAVPSTAAAGTAGGTYDFTGSATGAAPRAGTATRAYDFTGSATGARLLTGSSIRAYDFTGSAIGVQPTKGSGAGVYDFAGSATGVRAGGGGATGTVDFTGGSTGTRASLGSASADFDLTGSSRGTRTSVGLAANTYNFTGFGIGGKVPVGGAHGTFDLTGTAEGVKPPPSVIVGHIFRNGQDRVVELVGVMTAGRVIPARVEYWAGRLIDVE